MLPTEPIHIDTPYYSNKHSPKQLTKLAERVPLTVNYCSHISLASHYTITKDSKGIIGTNIPFGPDRHLTLNIYCADCYMQKNGKHSDRIFNELMQKSTKDKVSLAPDLPSEF